MNYLAHAYLSFGDPHLLAGNMISDFVKGKQKFTYSTKVQQGIMLHRMIDTFTDCHEATYTAKRYFKTAVGAYSGAFADVMYDHFLALDKTLHSLPELKSFAAHSYSLLDGFADIMPEKFARMFPFMKMQDWLYHYSTLNGIQNSFAGLAKRAVYLNNSIAAYEAFIEHYDQLRECYTAFFPDVQAYTLKQISLLNESN